MRKLIPLLIVLFMFSGSLSAQWQKVTLRLQERLDETSRDQYVRSLVVFNDQVDIVSMDEQFYAEKASIERRTYEVITSLQAKARESQADLMSYLSTKEATDDVFRYESFWVVNMVMVEAKPEVIYDMAERADINFIDLDAELLYDRPVHDPIPADKAINSVEDGVKIINAQKLWEMGITGEGRLIMGIDTGVDVTHPALSYKWHGNNVPADQAWFDPSSGTSSPNDCDGHGTHTMGTMTGHTSSDTVGVAIDAEWIASNSLCGGGSHTSRTIASFEWAMDPDNNPNTIDDMPDAITNSWYDPSISNDCNSVYKQTLDAVEAVGIAPIFSAGNSGPGTSTITSPKNINTNTVNIWATAAIDGDLYLGGSNTPIASFSSRGPSSCGGTGSLLIKPEASAPGVDVRSSYPGGGYTLLSGTSMAAPHVAGAVTLLRQFAPQLTGKQIKEALYATAKDLGTAGEDNNYGMGLIDVYAAMLSLGTPDNTPPQPVVDLDASNPTSNSVALTWTVPVDTSMNGVVAYDIRYSTSAINDTNAFNSAMEVDFIGAPQPAGEVELVTVDGLEFSTTYYFAVRSFDIWGNGSDISNSANATTYDAPELTVTPDEVAVSIGSGETKTENVNIENTSATNSTLDFNISLENNTFPEGMVEVKLVPKQSAIEKAEIRKGEDIYGGGLSIEGAGGPDAFGYEWIDSDEENGPEFVWNDISVTGTAVNSWSSTGSFGALDEGIAGPFNLGFNFKYYGNEYSEIYFGTNGFLSFNTFTGGTYTNAGIPAAGTPNNMIAPFWDDLDGTGGTVYYQAYSNRFVVQYSNWSPYSGSGTFNFQVVLYNTGKIMYYYNSMSGSTSSATVGIENENGNDGLQIAYNSSYATSNKAVQIAAEPDWLTLSSTSGTLYNDNSFDVELAFRAEDYPEGIYNMDMVITSNDPDNTEKVVPVTMVIGEGNVNDWSVDVVIADAGTNETVSNITFGMSPLATDGIDPDLGEYELGAVPPTGTFDIRFKLPNDAESLVDYRNSSNTEAEWEFEFQPGNDGYPITISWEPSDLPAGNFILMDENGGNTVNVNMKSENSVVVTNTSIEELEIVYSQVSGAAVAVNAGWNIVSVPVETIDMSIASIFPDAVSQAYSYSNGYNVVTDAELGYGYWVKFPAMHSYQISGQSDFDEIEVNAGWNLVGPFETEVDVENIVSTPSGIVSSFFYGFNNTYSTAEVLEPGKGYWVKVSEEGTLNFGVVAQKSTIEAEDPFANMATITVVDADGFRQVLYTGKVQNKLMYEMPPAPPAGVPDIRTSENSLAAELSSGFNINMNSVKYPVKVTVNGAELKITDAFGGSAVNSILKSGESVVISDSRVNALSVSSVEIPEAFALGQNYPNPFNPTTTVSFALPLNAQVEIMLYDMLGQKVLSTGAQEFEAGSHKVTIDASQLSSGVYFYTIIASGIDGNKFVDTKKMMLMK